MSIEKTIGTSVEVTLGNEKHVVEKLALGRYAQLLLALKNLPTGALKEMQSIDTENEEESIQAIIGLIGSSWGSVLEIIAIGSGIEKDRIENDSSIGLDGGIALFVAIFEVNNLQGVVKQVKNLFNRPTA